MKVVNGFKIVKKHHDGRISSVCDNFAFPEHFRVFYEPHKLVRPVVKNTKLFAFTDEVEAKRFKRDMYHEVEMWSCLIYNPVNIKPVYFNSIEDFWNSINNLFISKKRKIQDIKGFAKIAGMNSYTSSVCCSAIKLLKRFD